MDVEQEIAKAQAKLNSEAEYRFEDARRHLMGEPSQLAESIGAFADSWRQAVGYIGRVVANFGYNVAATGESIVRVSES